MQKIDRLSALMSHFELKVELCDPGQANFWIIGEGSEPKPTKLILQTDRTKTPPYIGADIVLLSAQFDWGGTQNPLLAALPSTVRYVLTEDDDVFGLAVILLSEQKMARCGSASVLNRLAEVLIVRLMRKQIETAHVEAGLLGGLADPRLSRAIVAIHNTPNYPWRIETLAVEAGLSVSHFSELFRNAVGMTPLAYLRKWRLILARQDVERGDRIQSIANRYCYGSTEALSRAFSQAYGVSPTQIRRLAQETSAR